MKSVGDCHAYRYHVIICTTPFSGVCRLGQISGMCPVLCDTCEKIATVAWKYKTKGTFNILLLFSFSPFPLLFPNLCARNDLARATFCAEKAAIYSMSSFPCTIDGDDGGGSSVCVAGWLIYSILYAHPLAHLIGKVQSQPVLSSDESVLYVGSGDGDTYIHSLRADDGSEIWRYSAAGGKFVSISVWTLWSRSISIRGSECC